MTAHPSTTFLLEFRPARTPSLPLARLNSNPDLHLRVDSLFGLSFLS